ncbi:sugar ABC transporter permease [Jonesiaceae bacterium BS-20]|uniref:Sugar ABC transporter permease n=1 Tax=Jonesiaceae bacterium BS-20 TaxID=3120821 RepID=A0AAU7DV67_9MICO
MSVAKVSRRTAAKRRSGAAANQAGRVPSKPWLPWVFLAPFLVFFVGFVLAPAIFGLYVSMFDWHFTLPNKPFVGLKNYINLFTPGTRDYADFWRAMGATGLFVVLSVPLLVSIPLGVALLLNKKFKGRTFFRALYFAPYVLGVAVVGVLWKFMLDTQHGIVNKLLQALNISDAIPWLQQVPWVWVSLVLVTLWWTLGFNAIIYLAGLQNISAELYEAASLDGAGAWSRFRYVTIPGIRPVLIFVVIITILASANVFGQPYVMTAGDPNGTTRTAIMYMSETGLRQFRMGAASAMSYILALALMLVSIINFKLIAKGGEQ